MHLYLHGKFYQAGHLLTDILFVVCLDKIQNYQSNHLHSNYFQQLLNQIYLFQKKLPHYQ
ncbi:uncharacterized protein METZ01_LOCUS254839 [marine metagenome]|uniref:Uncharacterized protein n=1 Tax=marine metagenome TaxID=408172 RepID=A0A382IRK5_9ZZZZ